MAIVVLDALTRREWVKEDDLARDLKVSQKHLRRVLVYLEQVWSSLLKDFVQNIFIVHVCMPIHVSRALSTAL